MKYLISAILLAFTLGSPTYAEDMVLENFKSSPETRWRFVSDQVMGGVSQGQVSFIQESDTSFAHMTGTVSLENNGGFIQFAHDLKTKPSAKSTGITIKVRGNNQGYFVHLRTSGTLLPWHYYHAAFDVTETWQEIRLPFDSFKKSNRILRKVPKPTSLKSIGIVAYGRAHSADIQVAEVGFY